MFKKPLVYGFLASIILLLAYFGVLTAVSDWRYATSQFRNFWYFILSLAGGFGIQFGLFIHLKSLVRQAQHQIGAGQASKGMVVTSATTSTLAMISCCTHYLVNILPFLAAAGVVTFVAQYQIEFFWIGIAFNFIGIIFILSRIGKFKKMHEIS